MYITFLTPNWTRDKKVDYFFTCVVTVAIDAGTKGEAKLGCGFLLLYARHGSAQRFLIVLGLF